MEILLGESSVYSGPLRHGLQAMPCNCVCPDSWRALMDAWTTTFSIVGAML